MKLTVNFCKNTCTNEQVYYCSITKVQLGVSLKLAKYFARLLSSFESVDVSLFSRWLCCANCSMLQLHFCWSLLLLDDINNLKNIRIWFAHNLLQPGVPCSLQRDCFRLIAGVWIGHWSTFCQSMWQSHQYCPTLGLPVELHATLLEQNWGEQNSKGGWNSSNCAENLQKVKHWVPLVKCYCSCGMWFTAI